MPEKETIERAREDAREGKSPSTQAGEFVREEIRHIREGKHAPLHPAGDRGRRAVTFRDRYTVQRFPREIQILARLQPPDDAASS